MDKSPLSSFKVKYLRVNTELLELLYDGTITAFDMSVFLAAAALRCGTPMQPFIVARHRKDIAQLCNCSVRTIENALNKLVKVGLMNKLGRAEYRLNFKYVFYPSGSKRNSSESEEAFDD